MPISFSNLDAQVQAALSGDYPDIGKLHYVVDSDFRTAVQGWSRADRTGPLDLYTAHGTEAGGQYVFYTPGVGQANAVYATDRDAIQGAIDACVDFRGDTVFLTPGSYTIATTALQLNVANMRFLGPPVGNPRMSKVTIDNNITENDITVDNVELAFFKVLPLTTQTFQLANGADYAHFHHIYTDGTGVAQGELIDSAASSFGVEINNCWTRVDTGSGQTWLTAATPLQWYIHDCHFIVEGVTWTLVIEFTAAPEGNLLDLLWFNGASGSSVFTNLIKGASDTMACMATRVYVNGSAMTAAGSFETGYGATADLDIAECYLTGDASGEGGVAIALT